MTNKLKISLIAAIAQDRAIGKAGDLLWKIPEDMRHFKETTMGHPIIMGEKTFLSMGSRLLPGRTNIILSHDKNFKVEQAIICHSIEESLDRANEIGKDEVFVIGGGNIYQQFLPLADRLYLTIVEKKYQDADTYFPDYSEFTKAVSRRTSQDENYKYEFVILER
jgi:dihydrofolate reductase